MTIKRKCVIIKILKKRVSPDPLHGAGGAEVIKNESTGHKIDDKGNENDYLPASGEMRAIKIVYPSEYYAMPQYLTSAALVKIFRKTDKTFNGFMSAVLDEISI